MLVASRGKVIVADLARELGVSLSTIHRDLDYLEEHGSVRCHYGSVTSTRPPKSFPDSYAERAKLAIEHEAASLVHDDDTIFVSASTTSLGVLPFVSAHNITVMTNNLDVQTVEWPHDCTTLLSGGEMHPPRNILYGELALKGLSAVSTTTAFIGCLGVSAAGGATSLTIQEVPINMLMMARSQDTYLLADSSKFNVELGFKYSDLAGFSTIITDTGVSAECLDALYQAGARKVICVNPDDEMARS